MPTKFVTNAAERAGVSLETAEHRWAEAKKAVKKGKRRGSWYWGKVMNTFKRMMGLMEAVTLKEWLLLEDPDDVEFELKLIKMALEAKGFRIARSVDTVTNCTKDDFEYQFKLDETNGAENWSLSIFHNIRTPKGLAKFRNHWKYLSKQDNLTGEELVKAIEKWADRAVNEGLSKKPAAEVKPELFKDWPDTFLIRSGWVLERTVSNKRNLSYSVTRIMDDKPKASFYVSQRPFDMSWEIYPANELLPVVDHVFKSPVTIEPNNFVEAKKWLEKNLNDDVLGECLLPDDPLSEGPLTPPKFQGWPEEFMVGNGWTLTLIKKGKSLLTYTVGRLMDDEVKGYFYVSAHQLDRSWLIQGTSGALVTGSRRKFFNPGAIHGPDDFGAAKIWLKEQLDDGLLGEQASSKAQPRSL